MQTNLWLQVHEQANKVQDCWHRSERDASGILDKRSSDCTNQYEILNAVNTDDIFFIGGGGHASRSRGG